jgi:hypothetical protein
VAEKLKTEASSAASSRLNFPSEPKSPEPLASLDVGLASTGCHIPIDGSDFITGCVRTYFVKLHPTPFEYGVVFSGKAIVDQPAGAYFNVSNFVHELCCQHLHFVLS